MAKLCGSILMAVARKVEAKAAPPGPDAPELCRKALALLYAAKSARGAMDMHAPLHNAVYCLEVALNRRTARPAGRHQLPRHD